MIADRTNEGMLSRVKLAPDADLEFIHSKSMWSPARISLQGARDVELHIVTKVTVQKVGAVRLAQ